NETPSYWVHSTDDFRTKISNRGRIKCSVCPTVDYIKNWGFACSDHRGDYRSTSCISFGKALFVVTNNTEMDDDFIDDLTRYLRRN
ncbi:16893_t:CDS:1, partial [Racocetra fulgida]